VQVLSLSDPLVRQVLDLAAGGRELRLPPAEDVEAPASSWFGNAEQRNCSSVERPLVESPTKVCYPLGVNLQGTVLHVGLVSLTAVVVIIVVPGGLWIGTWVGIRQRNRGRTGTVELMDHAGLLGTHSHVRADR
jgi:hypothetical protein